MKLKVFSVYDSKATAYKQPFFMVTKGEAIRGIMQCLEKSDHLFAKYPSDFTLFELGEYDDSNGKMYPLPTPISHGNLLEFKNPTLEQSTLEQATDFHNRAHS